MITNNELQAVQLSTTKKDFYQIWNELLETAAKISERWDPLSTNESDPGIVLLKVLTAIADKLNYNIDKNILEAFMPSATQMESMRKLCEMMGYNIKYYRSATTKVLVKYIGTKFEDGVISGSTGINIPKFTNIKNEDDDINYITTESKTIYNKYESVEIPCIEGQLCSCESDNNDIISLSQLDDNNRYYLPETQIAENGLFIYNLNNEDLEEWHICKNLNTVSLGEKVFKFGYDSNRRLPYVQFPEDIGQLIEDGLYIYYIRTNGINGNISANNLTVMEELSINNGSEQISITSDEWSIKNSLAATNGTNIETINQAYNNYKKTIGTFDTLVTCRDYMNKIYQLTVSDVDTTPLVSNIIVSDIRDDINRSSILCTFGDNGIKYITKPILENSEVSINHFDLMLYPFKTVYGLNTKDEYEKSFTYNPENYNEIKADLEESKTISHNFILPKSNEIVCIKNYLQVNAEITTTKKVNTAEEDDILKNVKTAIYKNFNLRQLDFGEEIPEQEILDCILNADTRIKQVSKTNNFTIYTKIETANGTEYDFATNGAGEELTNKLILRNVLAGRVSLFNEQSEFVANYNETNIAYLPNTGVINELRTDFTIAAGYEGLTLKDNEVIQFRKPNYSAFLTYPAYVNYTVKFADPSTVVMAGTEYLLDVGDKIYFNYTPASTNENTTPQEVSICYTAGTIIRPNFNLMNSESVTGKSYTKSLPNGTEIKEYIGRTFKEKTYLTQALKMFTLSANEQIEIVAPVVVDVKNCNRNISWTLNSANIEKVGNKYKIKSLTTANSYILDDNEYFYITDIDKSDFAIYGSGTEIIFNGYGDDPTTAFEITEMPASEDIISAGFNGYTSDDYWVYKEFNTTNYLQIKEYKYINLTSGDIFINATDGATDPTSIAISSSSWTTVGTAKYQFKDKSSPEDLPKITIPGDTWQVRSKLLLNIGPDIAQAFRKESLTIGDDTYTVTTNLQYLKAGGSWANAINYTADTQTFMATTNRYCISGSGTFDVEAQTQIYEEEGIDAPNLTIKVYQESVIKNNDETVALNNFNNGLFTKYTFNNNAAQNSITLNLNLPTDCVGYIAWYLVQGGTNYHAQITFNNNATVYKINNGNLIQISANTPYALPQQLLLVTKITTSSTITISTSGTSTDIIYFSKPSIIKIIDGTPINKDLCLDLNEAAIVGYVENHFGTDNGFYYNCPIDNTIAINIKSEINQQGMLDGHLFYDPNNLNNKFTATEIDAKYLTRGVIINQASKLRRY